MLSPLDVEFISMEEIFAQFQSGKFLIILIGIIHRVFIPIFRYHANPISYEQRLHNIQFAITLMREFGMETIGLNIHGNF
jgi:parvin